MGNNPNTDVQPEITLTHTLYERLIFLYSRNPHITCHSRVYEQWSQFSPGGWGLKTCPYSPLCSPLTVQLWPRSPKTAQWRTLGNQAQLGLGAKTQADITHPSLPHPVNKPLSPLSHFSFHLIWQVSLVRPSAEWGWLIAQESWPSIPGAP